MILGIRHGETTLAHKLSGQSPVPLTAAGRQTARQTATTLSGWPFVSISSSDIPSARQSAQALAAASGKPWHVSSAWRSWDVGSLAGLPTDQAEPWLRYLVANPTVPAHQGESFRNFVHRLLPVALPLLADNRLHAVVTHRRPLSVLQAIASHGIVTPQTYQAARTLEPGEAVLLRLGTVEPVRDTHAAEV